MHKDTGEVRRWDELTEQERKSGDWVPLSREALPGVASNQEMVERVRAAERQLAEQRKRELDGPRLEAFAKRELEKKKAAYEQKREAGKKARRARRRQRLRHKRAA